MDAEGGFCLTRHFPRRRAAPQRRDRHGADIVFESAGHGFAIGKFVVGDRIAPTHYHVYGAAVLLIAADAATKTLPHTKPCVACRADEGRAERKHAIAVARCPFSKQQNRIAVSKPPRDVPCLVPSRAVAAL